MVMWTIYLGLNTLITRVGQRLHQLRAQPERGDLNLSTAIWAGVATTLALGIAAAITVAVNNHLAKLH